MVEKSDAGMMFSLIPLTPPDAIFGNFIHHIPFYLIAMKFFTSFFFEKTIFSPPQKSIHYFLASSIFFD